MNRRCVALVSVIFAFVLLAGCKKKGAEKEKPSADTMSAMAQLKEPARKAPEKVEVPKRPAPSKTVAIKEEVPKGPSIVAFCAKQPDKTKVGSKGKIKKHKKMHQLITRAGKKCKELDASKCPEFKALKQFVNDVWMNKLKLKRPERLQAYATAINLLLHKDKKIATAAVQGVINGYLYRHEWVVEKPELLPRKYILKMLEAVANMERSIDMGFLIQDVAQLAPAYGLTAEVFKVAQANLAKNADLVGYALTNMVQFGDVCLFGFVKANTADPKNLKALRAAAQATNTLLKKKATSDRHKYDMCRYSDNFVKGEFDAKTAGSWDFSGYAYRYFDVVRTCKRYQAIQKVKLFGAAKSKDVKKKVAKVVEELAAVKKAREQAAQ